MLGGARQRMANTARRLAGRPPRPPPAFEGVTLGVPERRAAVQFLDGRLGWHEEHEITAFEREFAQWSEAHHAVSFLGGRVALSASLEALGLRSGEVIVPGYTCVVVPNSVRFAGLVPTFADIELETYGLDLDAAKAACTRKTRAVILHHLYGLVGRDYEAIVDWARGEGLAVIEDCAQASGARLRGRAVGTLGDVAIHSLERTKVMSTVVGGLATTSDDALAERLRAAQDAAPFPSDEKVRSLLQNALLFEARAHGDARRRAAATRRYGDARWTSTSEGECRGERPEDYGQRLPPPLATLGRLQLQRVDSFNARRVRRARRWQHWADENGHRGATVIPESKPIFLRYPVLVPPSMKRDRSWAPRELGVRAGQWFKGELHPVRKDLPGCPNARRAVEGCINLPTLW